MCEDDYHSYQFQGRDREIFRSVMIELGEGKEIVGDPSHQLAGSLPVVKAEREFLVVLEQISAHVALHHRAHHVSLIIDE